MEDNVYKDDFEQFLKDTTDDFLMVPSRKVWYSIYNNMHPDRKWPSMAVCFLILSAVLYLGVSNNNSLSDAARRAALENLSDLAKNYSSGKQIAASENNTLTSKTLTHHLYPAAKVSDNYLSNDADATNDQDQMLVADLLNTTSAADFTQSLVNTDISGVSFDVTGSKNDVASFYSAKQKEEESLSSSAKNNEVSSRKITKTAFKTSVSNETALISTDQSPEVTPTLPVVTNTTNEAPKNNALKNIAETERSWKEDYAFRNKPLMNKFKERTSITYFITPSLGYRKLTKLRETIIPVAPVTSSSFIAASTANSIAGNVPLIDQSALNLEIGAVIKYALTDNLIIKGGIQANYTNYVSKGTNLGHPTQVQIAVNDPYNSTGSSTFSAISGSDMLNRSSLQIAMPVGADVKIAGSHKLKWYVGTSLQPTYVFAGNAYVLSADEKNYVSQNDMLRKWNLNTAIETFLSFKPSSAVTLNVGPQFRYQLFSSFKNQYNYSEKLYNVGMKIGISTKF